MSSTHETLAIPHEGLPLQIILLYILHIFQITQTLMVPTYQSQSVNGWDIFSNFVSTFSISFFIIIAIWNIFHYNYQWGVQFLIFLYDIIHIHVNICPQFSLAIGQRKYDMLALVIPYVSTCITYTNYRHEL